VIAGANDATKQRLAPQRRRLAPRDSRSNWSRLTPVSLRSKRLRKKNGLTPLDLGQHDPPARGSTPLSIIDVCRQLVVGAGVALRAVPRVLCIVWGNAGPNASLPEASTVRWWLQRLGLFALREPLEQAEDWVWIIDHSIQLGDTKVCVVLGLRLSQLPPPGQALRHEDMQALAVLPVQHSTGEVVAEQLEEVARRTGIPRQIVSDRGGDVKKGSELFGVRHAGVALLWDAAHHGACLLKRRLEPDSRWPAFVARLGQTKASIQQTSDAHLLAPSLRPKARYMNLAPLLKWSHRVLELLGRGAAGGVASARAEARYGWLREYRAALEEWSRCEATVRRGVEFFRTHGVYVGCSGELSAELSSLAAKEHDVSLAEAWLDYARTSSASARPGERLVASTEVIESVFGKWKSLERQASRSGITSYVLSLGALVGSWPLSRIKTALEATPVKHVVAWIAEHLPTTVQSQRRLAFSTPVNKTPQKT